jgi:hypothetical protein
LLSKSANTAEKQALLNELEDFIDEVSGMYDYDVEDIVDKSSCSNAGEGFGDADVEISSNANAIVTDVGKDKFNCLFKACPVVEYFRNGAVHSIYNRISKVPEGFNAYDIFTYTWKNTPSNSLNTDF